MLILSVPICANWIIDPFAQSWPRPLAWLSPDFGPFDREIRLNVLNHFRPTMLFLGNSRVQHGFDPNVPALSDYRVFNGAFVGGDPSEFLYFLKRAEPIDTLRHIIVGVDVNMLFEPPEATFNEIMIVPKSGGPRVIDRFKVLTSYVTTWSSMKLMRSLFLGWQQYYDLNGHANDIVYQREIINAGGDAAAMLGADTQLLKQLKPPDERFYDHLRELRDSACGFNTTITVVLPPVHVRQLVLRSIVGSWGLFDTWKRKIVDLSAERPACPMRVWDFATHNSITMSKISGPDAATPRTFWESTHFTVYVGTLVLDRMFNVLPKDGMPVNFGGILDHENIDERLMVERGLQQQYEQSHPRELVELTSLVRKVRPDLLSNENVH
jgi:hypothetical protein